MNKIYKITTILLILIGSLACSKEKEPKLNTGEARVGMRETEWITKENLGIINIPVTVEGEMTGIVKATIMVEETASDPAIENEDYLITSKDIIITPEHKEGHIEVLLIDNEIIEKNGEKTFKITIIDAKGADIDAERLTTTVHIKDNDANFYERLSGKWKGFYRENPEAPESELAVELSTYPENHAKFEKELVMMIYEPNSNTPCSFSLKYSFDNETKKIKLSMELGEIIAEGLKFNKPVGEGFIVSAKFNGTQVNNKGTVQIEVSDDMKTLTPIFEDDWRLAGLIYNQAGFSGFLFFNYPNLVLKK